MPQPQALQSSTTCSGLPLLPLAPTPAALLVVVQPCQQQQVLLGRLGAASKQQTSPLPSLPQMRS